MAGATQGTTPQSVEREYRTADNTFRRRIKWKKRQFYRKVLEDSPPNDDISVPKLVHKSPEVLERTYSKHDRRKATTPEEECKVFLEAHFPAPEDLPDEAPDLSTQHATEIEWSDIAQAECLRALVTTAHNKAPGEDSIPHRVPLWTRGVAAEASHMLISNWIRTGHHQNAHHRSISPALLKPREADYSNPRAWGLAYLLSMMGEWIEKVIATRLYYTTKPRLIPPEQFKVMPVN